MSLTAQAAGDSESQMQAVARGRSQGSCLFTVWNHRHHWTQAHRAQPAFPPVRSVSPLLSLCVCACLCTPAHSSFHNGQPSSVHHGRTLRSGRAPGAAVQGEGSSSLPRQLQQRSPRKDSTCPGLLGAQSSTQLLARRQAPGWSGSSAHAHRSGSGVTVVLLRPAILPLP